jgi:CheY-like chemotaxis protein
MQRRVARRDVVSRQVDDAPWNNAAEQPCYPLPGIGGRYALALTAAVCRVDGQGAPAYHRKRRRVGGCGRRALDRPIAYTLVQWLPGPVGLIVVASCERTQAPRRMASLRSWTTRRCCAAKSAGLAAESFVSAEHFLLAKGAARVVCLIIDIGLPGMSGVESQRHLARNGYAAPVVLIAAQDDRDDRLRDRAMPGGAVAFPDKPFSDEDLLHAIRAAVVSDQTCAEVHDRTPL